MLLLILDLALFVALHASSAPLPAMLVSNLSHVPDAYLTQIANSKDASPLICARDICAHTIKFTSCKSDFSLGVHIRTMMT